MLELNEKQRTIIRTELSRYNLQDHTRDLELIILGKLDGDHIMSLVRVFCQNSYLKGRMDACTDVNHALTSYKGNRHESFSKDNET